VYTGFCSYIRSQHGFLGKETKAYIMPKERSIDIDTELDFQFADFLMNKSHHSHVEKHQDHTTP
jgi:N-acylneuraminate cytidylyltransferase/CMP-N,N'-diacetyllegionaminic acid synthase